MVSFSGDMSCFSNCRRWIHTIRSYKYTHFISAFLGWHFALCDAGQIWVPCYWQHLVGPKAVQLPCKYFKFSVSKLRESEWDWKKTSTIIWTRAGRPQRRLSGYFISPRHHRTRAYLCSASLQNKEPSSKYLCFQSISGKKKKSSSWEQQSCLEQMFPADLWWCLQTLPNSPKSLHTELTPSEISWMLLTSMSFLWVLALETP